MTKAHSQDPAAAEGGLMYLLWSVRLGTLTVNTFDTLDDAVGGALEQIDSNWASPQAIESPSDGVVIDGDWLDREIGRYVDQVGDPRSDPPRFKVEIRYPGHDGAAEWAPVAFVETDSEAVEAQTSWVGRLGTERVRTEQIN